MESNIYDTNSMVQTLLRLKVIPENQKKVAEIINFILERIRVESGCASCHFYQDTSSEGVFLLLQEWKSKADLERHLISEEFRHIMALIELASEPPQIKFNTISKKEGIEVIESVRGQKSY